MYICKVNLNQSVTDRLKYSATTGDPSGPKKSVKLKCRIES